MSLFGTSAKDVPGARFVIARHVTSEPSLNLKKLTSRVVAAVPMFCAMNGVYHPAGPPSVFVMFGRYTVDVGAPALPHGCGVPGSAVSVNEPCQSVVWEAGIVSWPIA